MNTGDLPWTESSLYDWLRELVGGINLIDGIDVGGFCCQEFNGRSFIAVQNISSSNTFFYKKWIGISALLGLLIHEARHLEGPHHTSCCGIPGGCDQSYDLGSISSYGTQLWLNRRWSSNEIDMGLSSHSEEEMKEIRNWFSSAVISFEKRFCN